MAIADYDTFLEKLQYAWQRVDIAKNSLAVAGSAAASFFATAPNAGSTPTTADVCNKDTVGNLINPAQQNSGGTQRIVGHRLKANNRCMFWVADRLCHQGGLSGTTTTAQTTNLPTATLTRYTDGAGVMITLEIYVAVGGTGTTVSVSYTDNVNGAGRTSPLTTFGSTSYNGITRMIFIPLETGDRNPVSVESVTVTATTGTAGNFGVTLIKPLYAMFVPADARCSDEKNPVFGGGMNFPIIEDAACLNLLGFNNSTGNPTGEIYIAED